eukprot:g10482.t1
MQPSKSASVLALAARRGLACTAATLLLLESLGVARGTAGPAVATGTDHVSQSAPADREEDPANRARLNARTTWADLLDLEQSSGRAAYEEVEGDHGPLLKGCTTAPAEGLLEGLHNWGDFVFSDLTLADIGGACDRQDEQEESSLHGLVVDERPREDGDNGGGGALPSRLHQEVPGIRDGQRTPLAAPSPKNAHELQRVLGGETEEDKRFATVLRKLVKDFHDDVEKMEKLYPCLCGRKESPEAFAELVHARQQQVVEEDEDREDQEQGERKPDPNCRAAEHRLRAFLTEFLEKRKSANPKKVRWYLQRALLDPRRGTDPREGTFSCKEFGDFVSSTAGRGGRGSAFGLPEKQDEELEIEFPRLGGKQDAAERGKRRQESPERTTESAKGSEGMDPPLAQSSLRAAQRRDCACWSFGSPTHLISDVFDLRRCFAGGDLDARFPYPFPRPGAAGSQQEGRVMSLDGLTPSQADHLHYRLERKWYRKFGSIHKQWFKMRWHLNDLVLKQRLHLTISWCKELQQYAEELIYLAKMNTPHYNGLVESILVYEKLVPRYKERPFFFTRVVNKWQLRNRDAKSMGFIEFVDRPGEYKPARPVGEARNRYITAMLEHGTRRDRRVFAKKALNTPGFLESGENFLGGNDGFGGRTREEMYGLVRESVGLRGDLHGRRSARWRRFLSSGGGARRGVRLLRAAGEEAVTRSGEEGGSGENAWSLTQRHDETAPGLREMAAKMSTDTGGGAGVPRRIPTGALNRSASSSPRLMEIRST